MEITVYVYEEGGLVIGWFTLADLMHRHNTSLILTCQRIYSIRRAPKCSCLLLLDPKKRN